MDCNDYRENLTNYFDNELTTTEHKSMLDHEATCSDCLELGSEMKTILGSIKSMPNVKTSAGFENALYEKLHSDTGSSIADMIKDLFEPSQIGVRSLAAGFAVLMILVTGSYIMYNGINIGDEDGMPALSSPRFIEKSEKIEPAPTATDVIEDVITPEEEKTEEEDIVKEKIDTPSEENLIIE